MPRILAFASGLAIAALSLAACGSDSGDDEAASTAYASATASVGGELAKPYFEWIDRARIAEMTGTDPDEMITDERLRTVIGIGTGAFQNVFGDGAKELGFDPAAAPQSLVAGLPPDATSRFDGVDAEAVGTALQKVGYKPGSEEGRLELGEPNQPILDGPLADFSLINVNRVEIGDDTVTVSGSDEGLDAIAPHDGSLADDPAQQALNSCVDDPVAVVQAVGADATADTGLEALALVIPRFDDPSKSVPERICAVTDSGSATDLESTAEKAFGPGGLDPITRVPFEDELGSVDVSSSESGDFGVVQIDTNPPADGRLGILIAMYTQGALTAPLGGESPVPPGP
jgi:hypothetical protein